MNKKSCNILGVYVGPHGVSLTLLSKGVPVVAIQMERILGIKRAWVCDDTINRQFALQRLQEDYQETLLPFNEYFPKALEYILCASRLSLADIDIVAMEKRNVMNCPLGGNTVEHNNALDNMFDTQTKIYVEHHQGHQAQAFYASPFHEAIILTIDGRSWDSIERLGAPECTTVSVGNGQSITPIYESSMSLTSTYDWISMKLFGRRYCDGKTMGLASYGSANAFGISFVGQAEQLNQCASYPATGCVERPVQHSQFCKQHHLENQRFIDKWITPNGQNTISGKFISQYGKDYLERADLGQVLWDYPGLSLLEKEMVPTLTQRQVAWLCQNRYEQSLFRLINKVWRDIDSRCGSVNLCIAGGGGLNSVANGQLLSKTPFRRLFVFPNCGDEGLSFGFALWTQHTVCKTPRKWSLKTDYFGRPYDKREITEATVKYTQQVEVKQCGKAILSEVAIRLAAGEIIGWFQGKSEFGPRALGNRSILAHPGKVRISERLNKEIKGREIWRPFAPVILFEYAAEYFVLPQESPHMLVVGRVQQDKWAMIPAVVHVDGTARVQTLRKQQNSFLYDLIVAFYTITGLPLLLNTSFNMAGKPIVETPEQAIECFLQSSLDVLVMDTLIVSRISQEEHLRNRHSVRKVQK